MIKKLLVENLFGKKRICQKKKIKQKTNLVKQNFGQKDFGQKTFLLKESSERKMFLSFKNFTLTEPAF